MKSRSMWITENIEETRPIFKFNSAWKVGQGTDNIEEKCPIKLNSAWKVGQGKLPIRIIIDMYEAFL